MRRLAIVTGAFSCGIFLAQYLGDSWQLPLAAMALAMALGGGLAGDDLGWRVFLAGLGVVLAFGWNVWYVRQVQAPMERMAETEIWATLTVLEAPEATNYGVRVTASMAGVRGKVVLYADKELGELRPGQRIRGPVYLRSAARIREDNVRSFTARGVFLLANQRGELMVEEGSAASPRWWPVRAGQRMRETIDALFDRETGAFLAAILTGDRTDLPEQVQADFSEAGLYHILAVSGMHCGFLLVLLRLLVGKHRRRLLAGISALALVFYALLTGGRPSVVRACIMLLLFLAAPLFGRQSDGPTSLAAALFLILLANPFAAASVGLQLSFGAMAGIIWVTPQLSRLLLGESGEKHSRIFRAAVTGFSATMGALVLTAPLSGYYFGVLSLVSPLSNLLCLWAASGVFLAGLLAVLAGMVFPALGAVLGWVPALLVRYILTAAHLLAKLPCHGVYFANPYLKYWLGALYGLLFLAWLLHKRIRWSFPAAVGLAALALAVAVRLGENRFRGDLDAVILDVGQGQSILLRGRDGAGFALVDCGSENGWYSAGSLAACQLESLGCRRLDYLLLTHYDSDHVNGVAGLLARVGANILLAPRPEDPEELVRAAPVLETAASHGVPVRFMERQEVLALGPAATLTVFPPVGKGGGNQRSLSLLASAGEEDLLITGDMDIATERKLLETYDLPDIEYLVAGHHGSKHATSEDLLARLRPETICISVGDNNYGFPAEEALYRMERRRCVILRTDLQGNIHLSCKRGEQDGTEEQETENRGERGPEKAERGPEGRNAGPSVSLSRRGELSAGGVSPEAAKGPGAPRA